MSLRGVSGAVAWVAVLVLVSSGCAEDPVDPVDPGSASPTAPALLGQRWWSVDWFAGGGSDFSVDDVSNLRLSVPSDEDALNMFDVTSDGAIWSAECSGPCGDLLTRGDDLVRVDQSGSVLHIGFDFVDLDGIAGAHSSDRPVVVSGPVSDGGTGVYVVIGPDLGVGSRQIQWEYDSWATRRWARTFHIDEAGTVTPWQPELPEGFTVTQLGLSATSEVLVQGSLRLRGNGTEVSRAFAVDPATMQAHVVLGAEIQAYLDADEDSHSWERVGEYRAGNFPLYGGASASKSYVLLADGRVAKLFVDYSEKDGAARVFDADGSIGFLSVDPKFLRQVTDVPAPLTIDAMTHDWVPAAELPYTTDTRLRYIRPLASGGVVAGVALDVNLDSSLSIRPEVLGIPSGNYAQQIVDSDGKVSESGPVYGWSERATVEFDAAAVAGSPDGKVRILAIGIDGQCDLLPTGGTVCRTTDLRRWDTDHDEEIDMVFVESGDTIVN